MGDTTATPTSPTRPAGTAPRTIGLFAYDDMQALDLVGPLDVFGAANAHAAGSAPYALCVIGLTSAPVRAENGLTVIPDVVLEDAPALDTLLIPGGVGSRTLAGDRLLLDFLVQRASSTRRMVSVCTGIYLLAATGLLDGRRATTHWRFAADVARRFPAVRLQPEFLFLRDGGFATSGGLTAGMDLALALVEEDLGAQAALEAARELVMYVKRPGNQAQFSAPLAAQCQGGGRLGALVDWLIAHPGEHITVDAMADSVAMSARHFRRVFVETFGSTPARFVEHLRLDQACLQLAEGRTPIGRIAANVGFNSSDAFGRAFRVRFGASPLEYRERFGR
ncbi:GlxA family transcriptional regulator [Cognatiluteimonas telluris]|jgi:transcriptional regulator GlxA family with amidase domain|uniref:GlxA family transcriptional regulator n=1 Tax=Cognatiluteimonas telluris TaxID=1104775 RepID=UPI00140AB768|nr:DJ-1/PfpI family protein [Lysobacter telluris]